MPHDREPCQSLDSLTIDELTDVTAGVDFWHTAGFPRAGLRGLWLSDGPNGVRGRGYDEREPSLCTPCATALGASWDREQARALGQLVGGEATRIGVDVVLGPVLNIHRTPLGGRAFECISEDPLLTAELGACWIGGLQSCGVAATPKHFVANDAETSRSSVDCVVDERALREIYLVPFERAAEIGAWTLMTAYNHVNGWYCAEHAHLIRQVLKGEWEWDGVAMSDWFGTHDTVRSALGGLDLEMPGPGRHFGGALASAVRAGRVDASTVTGQVERLRRLSSRVGPAGDILSAVQARRLLRDAAASGFVLLKDEQRLLPLGLEKISRVAVLGPNADEPAVQGGGACQVALEPRPTPLESIRATLGGVADIVHEPGCSSRVSLPALHRLDLRATHDPSQRGFTVDYLVAGRGGLQVASTETRDTSFLWLLGPPAVAQGAAAVRLSAVLTPAFSGVYTFGIRATGRARLTLDDLTLISTAGATGAIEDPIASVFTGADLRGETTLTAGREILVSIEMELAALTSNAITIGAMEPHPPDQIERAAAAAAEADLAIVVVGTNSEIECEGIDRTTTELPGEQVELIRAVSKANPRTIVVVNAGGVVDLGWAPLVSTVMYAWFPGQEFGAALAAVLTGELEPSGRLPVSLGRAEDYPAWSAHPDAGGRLEYKEGIFVGYRHFDRAGHEPWFCFGHGLGYTAFEYESLEITRDADLPSSHRYTVTARIRNVGERPGKEVVQLYVAAAPTAVERPTRELKAFDALTLDPGEAADVQLVLDERAFSYWDPDTHAWSVDAGVYTIELAHSSRDIRLSADIEILPQAPAAAPSLGLA